jgi:hypothetical protein
MGTDVMGMAVAEGSPLARCVGIADTSLSLSLSLYSGFSRQKT